MNSGTRIYPSHQEHQVESNKTAPNEPGHPLCEVDLLRQTNDLVRLSLCIYQLQLRASSALPQPLLGEDITSVTRCLLKAVDDRSPAPRDIQKGREAPDPPTLECSSATGQGTGQGGELGARRQKVESLAYPDDDGREPGLGNGDQAIT